MRPHYHVWDDIHSTSSNDSVLVVGRLKSEPAFQSAIAAWETVLSGAPPIDPSPLDLAHPTAPLTAAALHPSRWRQQLGNRQRIIGADGEVRRVSFVFSDRFRTCEGLSSDGFVHAKLILPQAAGLQFERATRASSPPAASALLQTCPWWRLPPPGPTQFVTLSRDVCHSLLCWMQRHHPRTGPRALRFELTPGQPPQLVPEPRTSPIVSTLPYDGAAAASIRVWNARRLLQLANILPMVDRLEVELTGNAAPHRWTFYIGPARLTVTVFGADPMDWTRTARSLVGSADAAATREVSDQPRPRDSAARWSYREILAAGELTAAHRAIITQAAPRPDGRRTVLGIVDRQPVELWLDDDGLVSRGRCHCSGYRRRGSLWTPCRHLRALHLAATSPAMPGR